MSYHGRFKNAKNFQGKLYRDQKTGNLIEYCMHIFIVYPRFGSGVEYHANFIPLEKKTFKGFTGVCQECGEFIHIDAENVVEDETVQEKKLDEALEEVTKRKCK